VLIVGDQSTKRAVRCREIEKFTPKLVGTLFWDEPSQTKQCLPAERGYSRKSWPFSVGAGCLCVNYKLEKVVARRFGSANVADFELTLLRVADGRRWYQMVGCGAPGSDRMACSKSHALATNIDTLFQSMSLFQSFTAYPDTIIKILSFAK
jgi:hypothetical protein